MAAKRAKRAEWERRVEAWHASGESATTFAERNGWNARTLTWWASQGLRARRAAPTPTEAVAFVEVARERAPAAPRGVIDVVLRNGRRLRVRGAVDIATLTALARALEA